MNKKNILWVFASPALFAAAPQYKSPDITIPAASANEPLLKRFSLVKADEYLEKGALAWTRKRGCVTCHTTGTYMQIRPALTSVLGKPTEEIRQLFTGELAKFQKLKPDAFRKGTKPAEVIYTAAGLAEWDKHVTGKLSEETEMALKLMFGIQNGNGTWDSLGCWPPFESSAYQEANVAAMAMAAAPTWLKKLDDEKLKSSVDRLKDYLRKTKPPHDYGRALLLWTAACLPDLLTTERQEELAKVVWSHQLADGGWSIRTFAAPDQWGSGNRAAKLRTEQEFLKPASDGHMTGLAVLVLREAGVPAKDVRLKKAVKWLLANQRESGRWWTRSLNTDKYHYITYSGTAYPLLALMRCGALPAGLGRER